MIYLLNSGPGRFGNRLFAIHFLFQLKEKHNTDVFIGGFNEEVKYFDFEGVSRFKYSFPKIISKKNLDLLESNPSRNYLLRPPFLGEYFHETLIDINKYVKIKESFNNSRLDESKYNVAIHYRGTDFHQWNSRSILSSEYYINSVQEALLVNSDANFILYTDDYELDSYVETLKYLKEKDIKYMLGRKEDPLMNDFQEMSKCNMIISSPSTFCIWAGILGPEKKIIHSKEWMNYRIENEDEFWKNLDSKKSITYNLYKKI